MSFRPGIETLVAIHPEWLRGHRVGLVAHPASVTTQGRHAADFLRDAGIHLVALFGPEHGFTGRGGAGEAICDGRHTGTGLPIFSLYGDTRKPTTAMLRDVDLIVFDLHDLGARPYTYVSTLRLVLEAAAENGKAVVVADRPIPLPLVTDGPLLDPAFESFVGLVRTPVAYGMTPGETARFLAADLGLKLDLHVAAMDGFERAPPAAPEPWIPPSPAIRSPACAACFPATVFFEALPAVDHGRGTDAPFTRVGAPWADALALADALSEFRLPGLRVEPTIYAAGTGTYKGQTVRGLQLNITDPAAFRPVQTGISLIHVIQQMYGREVLWDAPGARAGFFDQLMGTDSVRLALLDGEEPAVIAGSWRDAWAGFPGKRQSALLYRG